MKTKNRPKGLSRAEHPGAGEGLMVEPEVRVVGVSRRIWSILVVLLLLVVGLAFVYFRAHTELDRSRIALDQALEQAKLAEIALKHETDAKEQAIADREQLVKELSAQGDKLVEFSRGEEQAKSQAVQASTGVQAAEKRISTLKAKLKSAEKQITGLTAELEVLRTELDQARADVEIWRARAEPYGPSGPPDGQRR